MICPVTYIAMKVTPFTTGCNVFPCADGLVRIRVESFISGERVQYPDPSGVGLATDVVT